VILCQEEKRFFLLIELMTAAVCATDVFYRIGFDRDEPNLLSMSCTRANISSTINNEFFFFEPDEGGVSRREGVKRELGVVVPAAAVELESFCGDMAAVELAVSVE
jgi:hypothetical protein